MTDPNGQAIIGRMAERMDAAGRPGARRPHLLVRAAGSRVVQLMVVLAVCALVRVWLAANKPIIAKDGAHYVGMARWWQLRPTEFVEGSSRHIGYPALVAAVHSVLVACGVPAGVDGWELAGEVVSMVSSLLAMVAIWLYAGLTFSWQVAWISALLFGVARKWAAVGSDVLTEPLSVCLQMWAVVLALWTLGQLKRRGRWTILLATGSGLCAGAGYLVRPEAILVVLAAVVLWLAEQIRLRVSWRLTAAAVVVALVAALVCGLPYMVAIGGFTKRGVLGEAVMLPGVQHVAGFGATIAAPGGYMVVRQLINKLFEALGPVVAVLVCLWVVTSIRVRWLKQTLRSEAGEAFATPTRGGAIVFAAMALALVPLVGGHYVAVGIMSYRYLLILAALLCPLAGVATLVLAGYVGWALGRLSLAVPAKRVVLPGVALLVLASLIGTLKPLHEGKGFFRQAGEFVGAIVGRDGRIVTDEYWILHYGGICQGRLLYRAEQMETGALLAAVLADKPTHLVLSDRNVAKMNPSLRFVVRPPAFVLMADFPDTGSSRPDNVRVWRTVFPFFDEQDYVEHNPDVRAGLAAGQYQSGFQHYVLQGAAEGRRPCRLYDEQYYLDHNPGVREAVKAGRLQSGLEHYVRIGASQRLNASALFDEHEYLSRYADVRAAVEAGQFRCGLEHYLLRGRSEGRQIASRLAETRPQPKWPGR